jgi:peptide/nickel transport system permease protein
MTISNNQSTQEPTPPLIDEKVGLIRRIWRSRTWYGTEWYITTFGGLILVVVILMTIFAPVLAPYDPNGFVGGPFIPPGQGKQALVGRAGESAQAPSEDLAGVEIGVTRNTNSIKVVDQLGAVRNQFQSHEEMVTGLLSNQVNLIFVAEQETPELLSENPGLEVFSEGYGVNFPMGTDNLGRDIVSRIIWGARTIMTVALSSALISSVIGVTLGLISGFISGTTDRVISLLMDSIYSFPGLLLAIAMVAMLGPGLINVAVAVSVIYIPTFFRVVRGQVLSVKEELYVDAARSLGATPASILRQYILPNVIPSIVIVFSLNVADAILTEAGLSFIGLGLPPDIPDWGYDISKGHAYLVSGRWWLITFPGLMITLVATGFSLLGEGLSEILNPRLLRK